MNSDFKKSLQEYVLIKERYIPNLNQKGGIGIEYLVFREISSKSRDSSSIVI